MTALPVLWLYGTSGVGKTTVTWELFTRLVRDGTPVGFVDIDQLGMCYGPPTPDDWAPEPAGDHGRHRLQARTLDAVVVNLQDSGARCVLVAGVTDPRRGVETGLVPSGAVTACRLRAEPAELGRRLAGRGGPHDDPGASIEHADLLERAFPDATCVDTTGLTVAQVADRVRDRTGWPPAGPAPLPMPRPPMPPGPPGEILWVCGPAAVGKSTIGWHVYRQLRLSGVSAAFADLDQLGFRRPQPAGDPGNHRLKAANLAAVWREFRASGADCLIVVGPLDRPEQRDVYTAALPATTITLCLLSASREVLAGRVARRGRGLVPATLAGDELIGQSPAKLAEVTDRSVRILQRLAGLGELRVEADDRPAELIAAEIVNRFRAARGSGILAR